MISEKTEPHNIDAEIEILGAIMIDPVAITVARKELKPQHFYIEAHQKIYEAAVSLDKAGKPTDIMFLADRLKDEKQLDRIGGRAALANIHSSCVSSAGVADCAEIVVDKWQRRELIRQANELLKLGYSSEGLNLDVAANSIQALGSPGLKHNSVVDLVLEIQSIESPVDQFFARKEFCQSQKMSHKEFMALSTIIEADDVPAWDEWALTADKFVERKLVDHEWLFEGFLKSGRLALLAAESKTGKSLLHYDIAHSVASGEAWGAFPCPSGPQKVLIVQTDEPQVDCQERIRQRGLYELGENVRVITKFSPHQLARLKKEVQQWRPGLIVFDSLTSIQRFSGYSPKDPEYAYFLYALKDLASEIGSTILVICHTNKSPVELGLDKLAGSYGIAAAASDIFMMYKPKNGEAGNDLVRLLQRVGGRSGPPKTWKLELNLEEYSYSFLGEAEKNGEIDEQAEQETAATLSTKQAILNLLRSNLGNPYEPEEIAEITNLNYNRIRAVCGELFRDGIVCRKRSQREARARVYYIDQMGDQLGRSVGAIISPDHLERKVENTPRSLGVLALPNDRLTPNDRPIISPDHLSQSVENTTGQALPQSDEMIAPNDRLNDRPEMIAPTDRPTKGQQVSVNVPDSNFYGQTGKVQAVYEEAGQTYISIKLDSNGYSLDYKPEFLLW